MKDEMSKKVRLTGLNIGPVGASWDFPESEKDVATTFLTFLEGRRVLYNPWAKGCPGGVVDSVQEIRNRIQTYLEKLPRGSFLFGVLETMRDHVFQFLTFTCRVCTAPVSCKDCKIYKVGCIDALQGFRKAMGFQLSELVQRFGLKPTGPINEIIPKRQ